MTEGDVILRLAKFKPKKSPAISWAFLIEA